MDTDNRVVIAKWRVEVEEEKGIIRGVNGNGKNTTKIMSFELNFI